MGIFEEFKPQRGYLEHWPKIDGTYALHDVSKNDELALDTPVIEYTVDERRYPICTVADLFRTEFKIKEVTEGSLRGLVAERIARRITKRFLQTYHPDGRIGGLFKKVESDKTIEHNDHYVLRISDYPNVVILKVHPELEGADKYESIAEIDGLFDYRVNGSQHIVYMESKVKRVNIPLRKFSQNIIAPFRSLRPQASLEYLIVAQKSRIFQSENKLWPYCTDIYNTLQKQGVQAIFMPFNESAEDFRKLRHHWTSQYVKIKNKRKALRGAMVYTNDEILGFDREHMVLVHLKKNNGVWEDLGRKSTKIF